MKRFILTVINEYGQFDSSVLDWTPAVIKIINEASSGEMKMFHMECDDGVKMFPKEVLSKSVFSIEWV